MHAEGAARVEAHRFRKQGRRAAAIARTTEWSFSTGGPGDRVDAALGRLADRGGAELPAHAHGPVDAATAAANSWCEVDGIGERLPIVVVTGPRATRLLKARRIDASVRRERCS
jgi:hypothetical protein